MRLPGFDCYVFNAVFCAVHCLLWPHGPNSHNGFSTEQRSTDTPPSPFPEPAADLVEINWPDVREHSSLP